MTRVTILVRDLWPGPTTAGALAFARWAHQVHPEATVDLACLWGGPWRAHFEAVVPIHVVNDVVVLEEGAAESGLATSESYDLDGVALHASPRATRRRGRLATLVPAVLRDLGARRLADGARGAFLRRWLGGGAADPVWLADPRAARLLHYVPADRPVLAGLQELAQWPTARDDLDDADLALLASRPSAWAVGGEAAGALARDRAGTEDVREVPDLLLLDEEQPDRNQVRARLAEHHGIDATAPLVVSAGAIDWWEVPDSFVQVAWDVRHRLGRDDVRFAWLAEGSTDTMLWPLRHDIGHAGLEGVVHVVPTGSVTSSVLTCADVVLLSRRGEWAPADLRGIEAIAPAIARWSLPDERPGRTGDTIAVEPVDDLALAEAVVALLDERGSPEVTTRRVGLRSRHSAGEVGPLVWEVLGTLSP